MVLLLFVKFILSAPPAQQVKDPASLFNFTLQTCSAPLWVGDCLDLVATWESALSVSAAVGKVLEGTCNVIATKLGSERAGTRTTSRSTLPSRGAKKWLPECACKGDGSTMDKASRVRFSAQCLSHARPLRSIKEESLCPHSFLSSSNWQRCLRVRGLAVGQA